MAMGDYIALISVAIAVVGLLGGWMQILHKQRTHVFNEWRQSVTGRVDRIDLDIRAVQTQLQAFSTDIAKGYVQRSEFIHALDTIAARIEAAVTAGNERVDRLLERLAGRP
jgi:glutaredoxin 2